MAEETYSEARQIAVGSQCLLATTLLFYFILCACVLPSCMCVRFPGTRVKDSHEPCGCWEWKPGSLEEHSVLLTTEQSPQPSGYLLTAVCEGAVCEPSVYCHKTNLMF